MNQATTKKSLPWAACLVLSLVALYLTLYLSHIFVLLLDLLAGLTIPFLARKPFWQFLCLMLFSCVASAIHVYSVTRFGLHPEWCEYDCPYWMAVLWDEFPFGPTFGGIACISGYVIARSHQKPA